MASEGRKPSLKRHLRWPAAIADTSDSRHSYLPTALELVKPIPQWSRPHNPRYRPRQVDLQKEHARAGWGFVRTLLV
jgi:hypothetical protein